MGYRPTEEALPRPTCRGTADPREGLQGYHSLCDTTQHEPLEDMHGHDDEDKDDEDIHPPQGRNLAQSGLPYRIHTVAFQALACKCNI